MCCAAIEKEKRRFRCGLFVQIVYIIRKEFACSALWSLVCTERFSHSHQDQFLSSFCFCSYDSQVVIRFDDTFRSSNIDKVLGEEKASQVNLQSLPRLFVCRPVPPPMCILNCASVFVWTGPIFHWPVVVSVTYWTSFYHTTLELLPGRNEGKKAHPVSVPQPRKKEGAPRALFG